MSWELNNMIQIFIGLNLISIVSWIAIVVRDAVKENHDSKTILKPIVIIPMLKGIAIGGIVLLID